MFLLNWEHLSDLRPLMLALQAELTAIIFVLGIAALFSLCVKAVFKEISILKVFFLYSGFGLPVGLLAYTCGVMTGLSRAPAVAVCCQRCLEQTVGTRL
jgi:hypothetical protein